MKIIKQNAGIEVDSKKLVASFQILLEDLTREIKTSRTFSNTAKGLKDLEVWLNKNKITDLDLHLTMEATGVYYESLAYYFHEKLSFKVHVVLPNTSNAFFKSHNLKSKTDDIDAIGLGMMGLERPLKVWEPITTQMRVLKKLVRERLRLVKEKTLVSNQLHSENASYEPYPATIKRFEKRLVFLAKQIKQIEKELAALVAKDKALQQRIDNVCTAKGLGFITAIGVVAEMNGFILFKNRNQIVSYTGYDVIKRESGTSVRGKTKISKKGNSYVRQMLYMAAMSAAVHDEHHKAYYKRIVVKTSIPLKANVAIQRKMLLLIYTLFTKNVPYDPNYQVKLREILKPKSKNEQQPIKVEATAN